MTKKDYTKVVDFVDNSLNYLEEISDKIDSYLEDKSESFMNNKGSNREDLGYALMELERALYKVSEKVSFLL